MDETLKVILIITSVAFIFFILFLVVIILNLVKSVNEIKSHGIRLTDELISSIKHLDGEINTLKKEIIESLNNFDNTSKQIGQTAKVLEEGLSGINETISKYKIVANKVNDTVMKPVSSIALYSSAISKAISTFKNFMRK